MRRPGQAHTAHTTFPVPLILVDPSYKGRLKNGALYDVAPDLPRDAGNCDAARNDRPRFAHQQLNLRPILILAGWARLACESREQAGAGPYSARPRAIIEFPLPEPS